MQAYGNGGGEPSYEAGHLSLAGRALLIRTSIFGLQNLWCTQVPISKYVVQEVESRIRSFLWSGKEGGKSIVKERLSDREKLVVQVPRSASLYEARVELPGSRRHTPNILQLYNDFQMLQLTSDREDEYVWLDPPGFTQRFMWNELRQNDSKKTWASWL
ncbi:hypothetical protein LIER_17451 [Lithospermum erythrorhizon]|uniref:Uncharacterized protein n=1 Tax=Lithospermum erythrorhizon TaxID=34254 RepID=A0AAV3QC02_LITER